MIAWANLRVRWRELLATVLAVGTGVALIGAVLLTASAARPPVQERFAATAALVVPPTVVASHTPRTDRRIPWSSAEADATAARLGTGPGVTGVVIDRSFPAVPMPGGRPAGDPEDRAGGHGIASLALGGYRIEGSAPRGPDEMVVGRDLGAGPGTTLPVLFADATRPMRVTGVTDGPGVYVADEVAARLAPGVRTIGVLGAVPPAPPGTTVLTGDDRGAVEPVQDSRLRHRGTQLLVALGLLTGVTTVVVVSAALSTTVDGRRRELGLLRAVGATPGQIRRTVLGEAALAGAAGALLGTAGGICLAPALHRLLVAAEAARGVEAVPPSVPSLAVAAAAGVLLSLGGGLAASRRAARAAPPGAVPGRTDGEPAGRSRTVGGCAALAVGAGMAVATAGAAGDDRVGLALGTGATLVIAAALLAPAVLGLLVRARRPARAAAIAAPVIVAVGFAVLIGGLTDTMAAAYPAERAAVLAGTVTVEQDAAPGLSDDTARALMVPGARVPLPTVLVVTGPAGPVAVDAVGTDGAVVPGTTVLSEPMADRLGVAAGDRLPARFADGTDVELRIAAVSAPDERRGDVAVARSDVRAHDPTALTDTAFLPVGAVPDRLPPGTVVRDAHAHAVAEYAIDARLTTVLALLLVAVSAGYGGLAAVNTVVTVVRTRRDDLALLGAVGATRGQLIGIVGAETGAAALLGAVLGVLVTAPPLAAVASGLAVATGQPVTAVVDPGTVFLAIGVCTVAAVGVAALSTGRATRREGPGGARWVSRSRPGAWRRPSTPTATRRRRRPPPR
ncbi:MULTISPECIES: ABC transporter permease [Pseudonocardia]|uniref:FtsX-like permease family protein n=2 Tax=Pseudonocardia TaxID=1847 RepID=A0A1Y2MZE2_PSEAH|nr:MULTISPECIES: ABC transporter permease [Pseudonocardia]OSY40339.1 FtsX-like permease family protein [Pseudonocardia autotrophica]TDN72332.1 putative ABC transport system permease protein [Pseudonocardia autotrophica]BBG03043.1 hypothetical protein Pdca_42520 [Pseudonocardia autotrophica]GEC23665.1 hypothetical protein PSA01_06940 [Pseudonocardia saturnea]